MSTGTKVSDSSLADSMVLLPDSRTIVPLLSLYAPLKSESTDSKPSGQKALPVRPESFEYAPFHFSPFLSRVVLKQASLAK